eukprot:scaffold7362_cov266-Pinguiococcus_pyrenoidosus.AAC.27
MRAALLFLATCQSALAYLPGVSPVDYEPGNILDLKVTAMTSSETELPYDYYSLAYCKPKKLHNENDNLGEFLSGERIEKSDYKIFVMQNDDCRILCKKDLSVNAQNDFVERIEENYLNHWIVDNLPAASLVHSEGTDEDEVKKTLSYQKGFPLGYKDELNSVYLFNHFSITLQYHEVREARFRIVGFKVEPYSVLHEFYSSPGWTTYDPNDAPAFKNCPGTYSSVTEWSRFKLDTTKTKTVIFTYDVHFEESNTEWASRWDVYLESNVSAKVHWFSIANSLLIVVLMSTMIILILVRSLRKDIHRYTRVPTDEDKADAEEDRGWKLVHGDVFRPPQQYRLLLCVLLGSGAQVGAALRAPGATRKSMITVPCWPKDRLALIGVCSAGAGVHVRDDLVRGDGLPQSCLPRLVHHWSAVHLRARVVRRGLRIGRVLQELWGPGVEVQHTADRVPFPCRAFPDLPGGERHAERVQFDGRSTVHDASRADLPVVLRQRPLDVLGVVLWLQEAQVGVSHGHQHDQA